MKFHGITSCLEHFLLTEIISQSARLSD
jgi:hypothetical protein